MLTRKKDHRKEEEEGSRTDENNKQLAPYITLPSDPITLIHVIEFHLRRVNHRPLLSHFTLPNKILRVPSLPAGQSHAPQKDIQGSL